MMENENLESPTDTVDGAMPAAGEGAATPASEGEGQAYTPETRLERAVLSVYENEQLSYSLVIASMAIVVLTAYALAYELIVALSQTNYYYIISLLFTTGVPFAAVSIFRRLVNAPRPYELYAFFENKPKNKSGRSFPSRHVFSVFVIGSALCFSNLLVGILLLAAGAVLALVRVLLGYHFIRDVVAGALIGVLSGTAGMLVFTILL